MRSVNLIIGGPQGGGLDTVMRLLARLSAKLGYSLIADREYYSNIKGRHSYVHVRISVEPVKALTYPVDLFIAMDAESVYHHFLDVRSGGYIVYNTYVGNTLLSSIKSMRSYTKERIMRKLQELGLSGNSVNEVLSWVRNNKNINVIGLNYELLVRELVSKGIPYPQASRLISTIVVTIASYMLGLSIDVLKETLHEVFRGREGAIRANELMVEETLRVLNEVLNEPPLRLAEPSPSYDEVMVVTGNDVVAMGKIIGGLRYQSYYPITPAADESFYMEDKERLEVDGKDVGSVVVIQTEDEIAAITSAIGAALAGARAATSTSGPGFSLMVEALGWAGINEVPLVITYYQRGGPSTGMPTRGSQSDLLFSLFASHGEFPKVVIASGDHEEAFKDSVLALNIAEKYQVPVIHLLDKFIANTIVTMPIPNIGRLEIDRGFIAKEGEEPFKRFNLKYLVSPRPLLGQGPITYYTGNEHDEYGHITEDPELRIKMYSKRMKKLELISNEIPDEVKAKLYGPPEGDILVVGWGSVKGAVIEATKRLSDVGVKSSYLHIRFLLPYPTEFVRKLVSGFSKVVFTDHSYLVQIGLITKLFTGIEPEYTVAKFTGRPIYVNELVDALLQIHEKDVRRVVLSYGS